MSFPEADFQQSTTESPLGNGFPTEVGYIKGELTNVRAISLISLNRHAEEQKQAIHRHWKCYGGIKHHTDPSLLCFCDRFFLVAAFPAFCCAHVRGPWPSHSELLLNSGGSFGVHLSCPLFSI